MLVREIPEQHNQAPKPEGSLEHYRVSLTRQKWQEVSNIDESEGIMW